MRCAQQLFPYVHITFIRCITYTCTCSAHQWGLSLLVLRQCHCALGYQVRRAPLGYQDHLDYLSHLEDRPHPVNNNDVVIATNA